MEFSPDLLGYTTWQKSILRFWQWYLMGPLPLVRSQFPSPPPVQLPISLFMFLYWPLDLAFYGDC